MEAFQDGHDLAAGFDVEVAGRFVGEKDSWLIHQGAGDGDALALAAAEMLGAVPEAVIQAHFFQQVFGPVAEFSFFDAEAERGVFDHGGQHRVFQDVQFWEQMIELEDEAELGVAQSGARGRRRVWRCRCRGRR